MLLNGTGIHENTANIGEEINACNNVTITDPETLETQDLIVSLYCTP